jgi:hypothetical protein
LVDILLASSTGTFSMGPMISDVVHGRER